MKENRSHTPIGSLVRIQKSRNGVDFFSSPALELRHRFSALHYGFQIALPMGSMVLPAIVFSNIAAAA